MEQVVSSVKAYFVPGKKCRLLYVEGNIGSGKNEVIAALKKKLVNEGKKVFILTECVERWSHEHLLQDQYLYPDTRSGKRAFEAVGALRDYIERQRFINEYEMDYDLIIIERHPSTTIDVFQADSAVKDLYGTVNRVFPFMKSADLTLYLKSSPEKCLERIKSKRLEFEATVHISWLRELDELHDKMVEKRRISGSTAVTIDATHNTPQQIANAASESLFL